MTVRELIEKLQEFPNDAEVWIEGANAIGDAEFRQITFVQMDDASKVWIE